MTMMPANNPMIKNYGLPNVLGGMAPAQKPQAQANTSNVLAGLMQPSAPQQKPPSALTRFDQRMTKALSPDTTVGGMVHGFARGLNPDAYDRGQQSAMMREQQKFDMQQQQNQAAQQQQSEQMQVALATGQHLLQMPEQQRLAMVQQDWDKWSVLVGAQGMAFDQWLAQDPTALTDQGLQTDLAALQAQMGQGPDMEAIQRQQQAEQIRATMGDKAYYAYLNNPEEFGKNLAQWQGMNNKAVNDQIIDMTTGQSLGDFRDPMTKAPQNELFSPDGTRLIQGQNEGYVERENRGQDIESMKAQTARMNANKPRYGITVGPDGTVQIGGTPRQQLTGPGEEEAAYLQDTSKMMGYQAEFDNIIGTIDETIPMVGNWTAGMGSVLKAVPGSSATDLQSKIDTLQAYLSFERLQRMREESKTGGALGSVTERELDLLASTVASLKTVQSPEQLRYHLEKIKGHMQTIDENRRQMFLQRYQTGQQGDARTVLNPNATVQGNLETLQDDDLLQQLGIE